MPAPPPPQPPIAGELLEDEEAFRRGVAADGGRQIFLDGDINESKTGLGLAAAYSPPFLFSSRRRANGGLGGFDLDEDILSDGRSLLPNSSTKSWNVTDDFDTDDDEDRNRYWPFGVDMQHLVFVAMCLCLVSLVLIIIVALKLRHLYLRWRRRRRGAGPRIAIIEAQGHRPNPHTPQCNNNGRRGLLSRMLARIEEFDSLTPLIITPNSLSDDDHVPIPARANRHHSADRLSTATNTTNTPVSFRGSPRRRPRGTPGAKITLFPLASNARRAEPYLASVVVADVTSESGGDSIGRAYPNGQQTRLGVTGANGVVMRNPFEDLDLVSIDRTSGASTLDRLDRRSTPNDLLASTSAAAPPPPQATSAAAALSTRSLAQQPPPSQSLFHQYPSGGGGGAGASTDVYPLSTLPPSPASTDVLIPVSELLHSSTHNLLNPISTASNNNNLLKAKTNGNGSNGNAHYRSVIKRESASIDSLNSNLSSPMDSSVCGDTGSPLDTTGSLAELSDSVYMASESENSEMAKNAGRIYSVETGATQRWYTVSNPTPAASTSTNNDSDKSEADLSTTFEFETTGLKRYVLHRIEEESIQDEMAATGGANTATSASAASKRSSISSSKNGKKPPS